jgi:putative addiction module component (TIGR02574 family)
MSNRPFETESSEEARLELDRRIAEMDSKPDDEVPWEFVKAEVLEELKSVWNRP